MIVTERSDGFDGISGTDAVSTGSIETDPALDCESGVPSLQPDNTVKQNISNIE
jgi:hypothetical protein